MDQNYRPTAAACPAVSQPPPDYTPDQSSPTACPAVSPPPTYYIPDQSIPTACPSVCLPPPAYTPNQHPLPQDVNGLTAFPTVVHPHPDYTQVLNQVPTRDTAGLVQNEVQPAHVHCRHVVVTRRVVPVYTKRRSRYSAIGLMIFIICIIVVVLKVMFI